MKLRLLPMYEASWIGVLRVAAWCLLFLYAFGKFIPALPEHVPLEAAARGTSVIPLLTTTNDYRTVREDIIPHETKTHIAWISDSSGVMIDPGGNYHSFPQDKFRLLPVRVAEKLTKDYKVRDFDIPLYLRLSTLPIDTLIFTLRALKDKPDFIVLPINNVWSFSHYQVASRDLSMHLAPAVFIKYPRLWAMMLAFCTPVQHLSSFTASYFDILHNAVPIKEYLRVRFRDLLSATGIVPKPAKAGLVVPITNVPYWIYVHMLKRNLSPLLGPSGKVETSRLYNQVIQHATPNMRASWAADAFHNLIDILKESGIPVLIYSWPVSDRFLDDNATRRQILEINAFLLKQKETLDHTNIRILTPLPEKIRKSVTYLAGDDYHVTDEGILDDYLAANIFDMLKRKSATTGPKR